MPDFLPPTAGVSLSEAIAEAYAHAVAGDPVLVTLELRHPSFRDSEGNPTSAWVVNDFRNLVANDENGTSRTFIGVPFRFTKPEQSDQGAPRAASIEVDNVSLEVSTLLLQAVASDEPVQVVVREYLPSDPSGPHVLPVTVLELEAPVVTVETVQAQLTFGGLANKKYPFRTYTAEAFPSLAP